MAEVIDLVPGLHIVIDTCGFGGTEAFVALAQRADLVFFDLKVMDPAAHRRWTGQDNAPILRNLALLAELRRPFVARIPLVPGVTDTSENLTAIAAAVASQPTLVRVELLPYNRAAGGKYAACGMKFLPGFDEDRAPNGGCSPIPAGGHRGASRLNERLQGLRSRTRDGHFRRYRQPSVPDLGAECDLEGLSWPRRMARLTRRMCEAEQVVIEPDERIVFTRTLTAVPPVYSSGDLAALTDGRTLHEGGLINNVCADWEMALAHGLLGRRHVASETRARMASAGNKEALEFLDAAIETIDAVLALAGRYAAEARRLGKDDVANALGARPRGATANVPRGAPVASAAPRGRLAFRPPPRRARPTRPVPVAVSGVRSRGSDGSTMRQPRTCWPSSSSRSIATPTFTPAFSRATTARRSRSGV